MYIYTHCFTNMYWCIEIDLIYADLNVHKSLLKMQRKDTLLFQNTWMKRTERMVEERRKGGKRKEGAEVKTWQRSLQLLFSLWKWQHKALFLSMLPCWSPVELWVQTFLIRFKVPVGSFQGSMCCSSHSTVSPTATPCCSSVTLTTNCALMHLWWLQMDHGWEVLWNRVIFSVIPQRDWVSIPLCHSASAEPPVPFWVQAQRGQSHWLFSSHCVPIVQSKAKRPPTAQDSITLFHIRMHLALMIPLQTISWQFHVGSQVHMCSHLKAWFIYPQFIQECSLLEGYMLAAF